MDRTRTSPIAWLGWIITSVILVGIAFAFLVSLFVWAWKVQPWLMVFGLVLAFISYLGYKASEY